MQPVAPKRCARVLAGRLIATHLPARTRWRRWLRLILKDHKPTAKFRRRDAAEEFLLLLDQAARNGRSHPIDFRRRESRVEQLLREHREAFGDRRIGLLPQIG